MARDVRAAIWGVRIELGGWVCPFTPLVFAFAVNVLAYTRTRRKPPAADDPANASQ